MDSGFRILEKMIQAAGVRQKVITSNIANADTPGYKGKDVKFGEFLDKEISLATTDSNHLNFRNNKSDANYMIEENYSWGDRNNVELNKEVANMTENALFHDAAIKILSSKIKMFKIAIRGPK